jgi:2-haloacid dehalogenase
MPLPVTHARAIVFDAYGTLFDVHSAVMRHSQAIGPVAAAFSAHWRMKQLEYTWVLSLMGEYRPFWALTGEALDHALAAFPSVERGLREPLMQAYRGLSAYGDVPHVLAALRAAGLKTAILSNGDTQMLADAVASAGLASHLDAVISVDEAGVFKTSPRTYALVQAQLGVAPEETVFVSSNRWDVAGASAFGFATIWCNRTGQPNEYLAHPPRLTVSTLQDLL